MSASIPMAVLMCHAPIVIPEIGGKRGRECRATTEAMVAVAERVVARRPDVLVVLSPHAPRKRQAWGLVDARELFGDFGMFGQPELGLRLPVASDATGAVRAAAHGEGLDTWSLPGGPLDHGSMVPLHFVTRAGWSGPTVLISLPWPWTQTEVRMGRAIRAAAAASGQRWVVLASGDMSHRLIPGAPAGFHPEARQFDQALVDAVTAGDLRRAAAIEPALRELAAEDAVDTVTVAAAAVEWDSSGHETLHYEGPYGVGYMEAVLHEET